GVLADWRARAGTRLAGLQALHAQRAQRSGELAFLVEPDLKEARGGLRDAGAIHAMAAAWVAPSAGPRVRAGREAVLDARHALHEVTGRPSDRLVLQEQDEVARALGLADADALLRHLAGAGRTIAYAFDQSLRQAQRGQPGTSPSRAARGWLAGGRLGGRARPVPQRRPLADGLVEQDGEVVLARAADPARDPGLPLRARAAAAEAGRAPAPRTPGRPAGGPPVAGARPPAPRHRPAPPPGPPPGGRP